MDPAQWEHIKELFASALEREPGQRNAFLKEACGDDKALREEVESLVAAHQQAGSTVSGADLLPAADQAGSPVEDSFSGRRIGHYQFLRRIGQGGMAAVYLAVRADDQYKKRVAIKLIPAGLDSEELLRRFRNERQTLAALDHPNIVKLLDGGTTEDGLPYLVMDYVEGTPINEYCDARRLSTTERLELFRKVSTAVSYAHQRLVIHRDLKPGNILVTADGTPKLLDFGIAKLLNPESAATLIITHTGQRLMTPEYASPEQVRGEPLTNATDVYSLGVVLYELLTGHRPYHLKSYMPVEIERAICETEPLKPSTVVTRVEEEIDVYGAKTAITPEAVSRTREGDPKKLRSRLHGDLDAIVLMALRKEPQRRYASVYDFSEDIRKHLEDMPVQARPSTISYRGTKFLGRHKEAAAATLLPLLLFAGTSVYQARKRSLVPARSLPPSLVDTAHVKLRRSVAVLGFKNLSGHEDAAWLSTALSEMMTTELAAGEKLRVVSGENVARMKIDLKLTEADTYAPDTLAKIRGILGVDEVVLGSYLDLGSQFRLDLKLQDPASGETVDALTETGSESGLLELISRTGKVLREKLGLVAVSPAEAVAVQATLPSNQEAARLYAQGLTKLRIFDALAARDLLQKAVALEPNSALVHSALAAAWSRLGYSEKAKDQAKKAFDLSANLSREEQLAVEGQYREATKDWGKAVEIYRTLFDLSPDNLDYGLRLTSAQTNAGRGQDALATVAALRKLPAPVGNDLRIELEEGWAAHSVSDYKRQQAAAERAAQKGRADGARLLLAAAVGMKGAALEGQDKFRDAMLALEESRKILAAAGDGGGAARAMLRKGEILRQQGDLFESKKELELSLATFRAVGDKKGEAMALVDIGNVLVQQGDTFTGKKLEERALIIFRQTASKSLEAVTINNIGELWFAQGDTATAEKAYREALALSKEVANRYVMALVLSNIGNSLFRRGDLAGARQAHEESLSIAQEIGDKERSAEAFGGLASVLMDEGDLPGARKQYEMALNSQNEMGERNAAARTRVSLAALAIEQGRPAESETLAGMALEEFRNEKDQAHEILAAAVLARALLAQGKSSDARKIVDHTKQLVMASHSPEALLPFAIAAARVMAASGKPARALNSLRTTIFQAQRYGFFRNVLEARLTLDEIEMRSGQTAAARAHLEQLVRDATAKGFLLIARQASAAKGST